MKKCRRKYLALVLAFFLGLREGKIALWQSGSTQPQQIFPYRAETLPPEVQDALAEGMAFESRAEALETVENFLS